jgi:hypothetical protein
LNQLIIFSLANINPTMPNAYNDNLVNQQVSASIMPQSMIEKHDKYVIGERVIQRTARDAGPFKFDGTNTIHIDLDSPNELVDLSKSYLEFDVSLAVGTTGQIDGDAHSFFNRVTLSNGYGVELQDIREYASKHLAEKFNSVGADFCARSMADFSDNITLSDSGKLSTNNMTTTATKMSIVLDLPIVQQVKILPLPVVGGLHFQLNLTDDEDVFCGGGSTHRYQISNVKYKFHMIRVDEEYLGKLRQAVAQGQYILSFPDVITAHGEDVSATTNSVPLGINVTSFIGLLARFYLSGDAGAHDTKYLSKSQYIPTLTDIHLQLGSDQYPNQPIDSWVSAYEQLQELFATRLDGSAESLQTRAKYIASDTDTDYAAVPSFHIGIPLTSFGLSDGVNTVNLRPTFNIACSSAVSTLRTDVYMFYARHILLKPDLIHVVMV